MTEKRPTYHTKITPPETIKIRLTGTPSNVAATAAWLRAAGLSIERESSDRPSRKEAGAVLRYLVAGVPVMTDGGHRRAEPVATRGDE